MYLVNLRGSFVSAKADAAFIAHTSNAKHFLTHELPRASLELSMRPLAAYSIARISYQNNGENSYNCNSSGGAGTCTCTLNTRIIISCLYFGRYASSATPFTDSNNIDGTNHGARCNSSTITALGSVAQDAQARGYLQETVANLLITDRKTQASNDIIDGLANASTPVGLDSSTSKADAENTPTASKTSVGIVAVRDKNNAEPSSPIVAGLGAYLHFLKGKRDLMALQNRIEGF
ncbi:peptidase S8/S53 domain-containing protein [Hypoxylon argillaceum]|nr:peptidase S8/S53 domain-containing protein [Hypoxylon argillaceum]